MSQFHQSSNSFLAFPRMFTAIALQSHDVAALFGGRSRFPQWSSPHSFNGGQRIHVHGHHHVENDESGHPTNRSHYSLETALDLPIIAIATNHRLRQCRDWGRDSASGVPREDHTRGERESSAFGALAKWRFSSQWQSHVRELQVSYPSIFKTLHPVLEFLADSERMVVVCRGLGTCGTCAVEVVGNVEPQEWGTQERLRLNFPPHNPSSSSHLRLACQVNLTAASFLSLLFLWWSFVLTWASNVQVRVEGDVKVIKYNKFWGQVQLQWGSSTSFLFVDLQWWLPTYRDQKGCGCMFVCC